MSVSLLNVVLPLSSMVLSFVFAGMVFSQWRQRRQSFQLVWTIGLLFYGISAGTEFLGGLIGWNSPLYRVWYLIGAFFVAAYLGAGTIYLLAKSRFGYFAGTTIALGGVLAALFSHAVKKGSGELLYPGSQTAGLVTMGIALVGGLLVIVATPLRRRLVPHIALGVLLVGSTAVVAMVLSAPLAGQGWAVDPQTHVPVGSAFPGYVRVLTGPFNIAGALCLMFGAIYSAYVYMPKRKVLRAKVRIPVLAQLYGGFSVLVNLVASLPGAARALVRGQLNSRVPATLLIALGAFIPGVTSGLNRFGITWAFFLGEFLGVLFVFGGFLVSEEVFADVRLGGWVWARSRSGAPEVAG